MWSFLTRLFTLLVDLYKSWQDEKLREQGRQETIKEAQANVEAAETAAAAARTDPATLQRVRSRWDRAKNPSADK